MDRELIEEVIVKELMRDRYLGMFADLPDDTSIEPKAILSGHNPGRVFVDPAAPGSGLVWSDGLGGFYIVGAPQQADFLSPDKLAAIAAEEGSSWVEICGATPAWEPVMREAFSGFPGSELSWQHVYTAAANTLESVATVGTGPRVVPIADVLTGRVIVNELDFLNSKLLEFWRSTEEYLKLGIGWCAIQDDKVTGVCFSGFVHASTHGIDIEVLPEYRRQGIGKLLAGHFIAECRQKGLTPWWDCMETNIPSQRLAQSVGLRLHKRYDLWYWKVANKITD